MVVSKEVVKSMRIRVLFAQFIKFAGVGTVSFLLDYSLLIIFTEFFHFHYLTSTTMSFTASIIFNYLVSMRFVFTHRSDISRGREFAIFIVLSAIGLIFNNFWMFVGVSLLGIDYRITKILATMCVTLFNFVTRRMFLDGKARENRQLKKAAAAGRYIYVNAIAAEQKLAEGAAAAERMLLEYASRGVYGAQNRGARARLGNEKASNGRKNSSSGLLPADNVIVVDGVPFQVRSQSELNPAEGSHDDDSSDVDKDPALSISKDHSNDQGLQEGSNNEEKNEDVFSFDIDYDSTSDYSFSKAKRPRDIEDPSLFDY